MQEEVRCLPITIPDGYSVSNASKECIAGPIPGQEPTTQVWLELKGRKRTAFLYYWDGTPFRDLGPMTEGESWPTEFLGQNVRVVKTKVFMGQEQEALVVHCHISDSERWMICSTDMNKDEFHELLGGMYRNVT